MKWIDPIWPVFSGRVCVCASVWIRPFSVHVQANGTTQNPGSKICIQCESAVTGQGERNIQEKKHTYGIRNEREMKIIIIIMMMGQVFCR